MAMTLTPTTTLEAVNVMLKAIGETPVNTLDVTGLTDAAIAQDILREITREVQGVGWYFNVDEAYTLAPAADGTVAVPANVLFLKPNPANETRRLVPREGKLYDKDAQSNIFDPALPPIMDVTWFFDFEQIPETFRRFITIRAARIFQDRVQGSDSIHSFQERDEMQAQTAMIAENDSYFPANYLNDAVDVSEIWSR